MDWKLDDNRILFEKNELFWPQNKSNFTSVRLPEIFFRCGCTVFPKSTFVRLFMVGFVVCGRIGDSKSTGRFGNSKSIAEADFGVSASASASATRLRRLGFGVGKPSATIYTQLRMHGDAIDGIAKASGWCGSSCGCLWWIVVSRRRWSINIFGWRWCGGSGGRCCGNTGRCCYWWRLTVGWCNGSLLLSMILPSYTTFGKLFTRPTYHLDSDINAHWIQPPSSIIYSSFWFLMFFFVSSFGINFFGTPFLHCFALISFDFFFVSDEFPH